ncbi:MAG: mechanosensitive ion channel domain-containing protein [Planctomycetota bacterium]
MQAFPLRAVWVLLLLVSPVLPGTARVQDEEAVDAAIPEVQASIGREEAQTRIGELQAGTDLDEAESTRLVELYRQLIQRLDAEKSYQESAETFRTAIDLAPAETEELRAELTAQEQAAPAEMERPEGDSEDLEQLLLQAQAQLSTTRNQLADYERRIAEEEARAGRQAEVEADARAALDEIEVQLAGAPAPGADAAEAERVERALLLARQRARTAEIAMLEQETVSRPARLGLLRVRRDLLALDVGGKEQSEARLESWLEALRQEEAERARLEAERLRREALGKHPLLQEQAGESAELTLDIEELLPKIAAARERRKSIEAQLVETNTDFDQTKRSLELGITRALGTVLLEQRRNLPDSRSFRRAAAERSGEVADAQLRLFLLERELKEPTGEPAAQRMLAEVDTSDLSEQDRADLRTELAALLAAKRENRKLLQETLRDYLDEIRELETQERALVERAEELGAILDERLVWIPDAPRVGRDTFSRLRADLAVLVSPDLWEQAVGILSADLARFAGPHALVGVAVLALVLARRRMRARLEEIATLVGKVKTDTIALTLEAFVIHVLRTAPLPGAAAWIGWRLTAVGRAPDTVKALGAGLAAAFGLYFVLLLLRTICRPDGIGRAHFRWTEHTGRLARKQLFWFLPVAVPATFITTFAQTQPDRIMRYGLGRLAFLVLLVAVAVFAFFLLRRSKGLFVGRSMERASTWLRRSRPLWLPLGVLVPIALAGMAAMGYYYAALQLEFRLNQTVLIILSTVLLHAFLLRWLMVSQRRLALRVALERRAAQAKKSAEDDDAPTVESTAEAIEEIDVVEIQGQTQDLLRISLGLLFVVALWFAWVEVLPALGVLDNVELWTHEVLVDGVTQDVPVTLANLGLALLLVLVTIAAARNMPGFLEIALLQRMKLEPGVRYATRTLLLYLIVAVGVVLAFNSIGVGWSSVQWLLAALTVGLGFGLQEIFANFVSGLILLLERPIRVGDTVTVGEISGVVTRIRMRATAITDWSRRELLVPNRSFITGELINWSLSDPILRLEFVVGLAYGSDTTLAHRVMLKACREHPMVLEQPEANVFFVGFGDNSLNFEARVFVNEPTNTGRSRIVHDLHMAIDRACREHDITIAFPQRDLHFKASEAVLRVALERPEPEAT